MPGVGTTPQERNPPGAGAGPAWSAAAAALTAGLLVPAQLVAERPLLLAERFVPGAGWVEIALLATYACVVLRWMADPRRQPRVRSRVWALFSAVFFAQLILGLAGVERCLMTGELHLPVPAMILAGPLYRGHPGSMVWLLAGTLLLVGPGWCSHLCYLGAWDDAAARLRRRPVGLPRWRPWAQLAVLGLVAGTALSLNRLGVGAAVATGLGIAFGAVGVALMLLWSRRSGQMVNCTLWCPIGLVTTTLGWISPFRIRIDEGCDHCGACRTACRYDALRDDDLARGKPRRSCTLCGDCVRTCPGGSIGYRFPGLRPATARMLYLLLVVTLHAATLGLARI